MSAESAELQHVIDRLSNHSAPRRILEAGCGSLSHLRFENAHVVGIDISEKQLARNKHLDEAIVGDVQTHELPERAFDLIVCWEVLEHLPSPELALENFAHAVKEGGLVVLALPNLLSVKGLATKLTPHWFHVWVYRRVFGIEDAGTEDRPPFKTYMKLSITPRSIKRFARRHGLTVEHFSTHESRSQKRVRKTKALFKAGFALLGACGKLLTFGRLDVTHSDYILVLRKPRAQS